jgi:hypothetical protein
MYLQTKREKRNFEMEKTYEQMTKKEKKEYNKKKRVPSFQMRLGTVTHKDPKHPSRAERKRERIEEDAE